MPFTFSHPALVLPFLRLRSASVSMSALVIGSITPDFEYFIKMKLSGRFSHSLQGIFLLDLPIAIVICILFHQVVKRSLIDNLPKFMFGRLFSLRNFGLLPYLTQHYFAFILCLVTGITSHILWDSFTHSNSYFVNNIEILSAPVLVDGLPEFPLYRFLQHGSTLIGACCILIIFLKMPPVDKSNNPSYKFWTILFLIAILVFTLRASLGFEYFGDIVTCIISSGLVGLLVVSSYFRLSYG